ncbi:MAG: glycosyltransferase [Tenericutes bacterium]|nr:glycosyltransferase [Mycoplasmatota bacterium]
MKNPKISVIVSVYNTEKYIEKCLDSLLNQTYSNIEIVVINDCSTDGSLKILKKYAKKYDNMILIENKENKGLSYSRNVGLEKATGEYIGYIDSDDYVDSTYYEQMMKAIKKEKSEIAIADMKIVYEDGSFPDYVSKGCNGEVNTLNIIKNGLAASACNKLFKREIIEKYKFSEGKLNEDLAVILPSIVAAKKISYVENNNYYYVQHTGSIQNSRFSDRRFDIFYGVELTLKRIKGCKNYAKISQAIIYEQLIVLLIYVIPKEKNLIRRHHILKKYNQLSKKYNIRKNQYFWKFLEEQGRKHAIYYKILFKLNCNGLYILADLWMLMYDVLRSLLKAKNVKTDANMDDLIEKAKEQSKLKEKVSVSVVIPNYNYKRFLYQRLYSILSQKEKINEIIILDDCSTDDSRKEIDKIVAELEKYIDIKKVYNEKNSGSAFKQWEKGFSLAKSEYVWIAEADDYCSDKLLKQLVKPVVKNRDIIISYADTAFIDTVGNYLVKSIVPEIDILNTGHWNRNYVNNGKDEFNHYTYLNCTIANVSSCIIKNNNYSRFFKESGKFKQCGDWLLYANIMQLGDVAYSRQTLNYYRIHGSNVSSVTKKQAHMDEMKRVHGYFDEVYGLNKKQKENINKRYKVLAKAWKLK